MNLYNLRKNCYINMVKYQEWCEEYDHDVYVIFRNFMSILKRKNMVYRNYSYSTFRRLVYMKSEIYG